jgi:hypothetical protein
MAKKPTKKLSDELRRIIAEAAEQSSLRHVARESGVDVSTLSRVLSGERGISGVAWDQLGEYLGLELRQVNKPQAKKGG